MELADELLGKKQIRVHTENGMLLPDPNLIRNIDHLIAFIEITISNWDKHSIAVNHEIKKKAQYDSSWFTFKDQDNLNKIYHDTTLNKKINERIYVSSIFSVATYYKTTFDAIVRLRTQLGQINRLHNFRVKPPKIYEDKPFHQKVLYIRDRSFVHQDSIKENNPMNKRTAMSWSPSILFNPNDNELPTTENYTFAHGKWHIVVDGTKTETIIDIKISGFTEFAEKSLSILEKNKTILIDYFKQIKESLNSMPKPSG